MSQDLGESIQPTSQPEKYGELTIIGEPEMIASRRMVPVRCSCGVEKKVYYHDLVAGIIKSCGHLRGGSRRVESKPKPKTQKRLYNRKQAAGNVSPVTSVAVRANGKAIVSQPPNFAQLGEAIDGLTKMARLVSVEQVEAMLEEIEQMESALPVGDWGKLTDMREHVAEGKRTAQAFLEFRRRIESVTL